ncbi:MAG: hypothetical protein M3R44_00640 [Candidatus Eremiobacteraeota bacterium]|nr:hypothetical protein [Candidatus Eremiobacteraeota bacterium]
MSNPWQAPSGQIAPPEPEKESPRRKIGKTAGGIAVAIAALFAKFKFLLFALLKFKYVLYFGKFGLTALSFVASIWFYALFFGPKFAIVFVLLIAIHEVGHVIFVRGFGLSAPAVFFLPGFGAFTTWRDPPRSVYQESVIAFGGPLLGMLGGVACAAYGYATHEPFWYACANAAFFLNLFNMIPLGFFDGGRMTGAISPALWIVGFVAVIVAAVAFHWWSPILLIVVLLSIPRAVKAFRGQLGPRYYGVPAAQRMMVAVAYFGLLAALVAGLVSTRVALPGQNIPGAIHATYT